jgi:2-keto-4-pentenoate hydratase/2-oxohepta-3-ene-1,7-dioic acid hydratase in catechol pathway
MTLTLPYRDESGCERPVTFSPSKIIGIGVNYKLHAAEMNKELPAEPLIFLKPPSAVVGPDATIMRPAAYRRVDFEGELGVVIGKQAKNVGRDEALGYVMGYTCVNDVSVRELQKQDGQWARAKGFDTFCPVGPVIQAGLDPCDLRITTWQNGEIKQQSSTADMVFDVPTLISFVSRVMTLVPGDLIATGTPSGVGPLANGDEIVVEIQGIGRLRNVVADVA